MQELKAILQEVNNDHNINEKNIIDKIRDELKHELPDVYDEWSKSSNCDINHLLIQDHRVWSMAVKYNNTELLECCKRGAETLLYVAARHGYTKIVENLLKNRAKTDVKSGYDGRAPLHGAALYGHTQVVEILLKEGAEVDLQDKEGKTPLHYAAEYGYTQTVEALLKEGTNVNLQDKDGYTPLSYAWHSEYPEIAKLLLDYGANPSCIHRPKAITAGITMGILATIVAPLVLVYATALSALAIIGITVASALIVGGISYGIAYKASEHSLNSKLSEVSCDNVRDEQTVNP